MTEITWFEVGLETLQLKQVDLHGWPEGMTRSSSRMHEECLEYIVALNLDVLFPEEDLLLIGNQFPAYAEVDVLAIGRFGILRLMEVKNKPTNLGDLQAQAIGYGIDRQRLPAWQEQMAQELPFLPERIGLGLEGSQVNARTEVMGEKYVRAQAPELLQTPWRSLSRFEQAFVRATAMRDSRGASPGAVALENPLVHSVVKRLYGIRLAGLPLDEPGKAQDQIVAAKWRFAPSHSRTEFTLISPELRHEAGTEILLEKRGALFRLVDAELRHTADRSGVERAVLRWQPVRRIIDTSDLLTALALQGLVEERSPDAGRFHWDPQPSAVRLYWHDMRDAFLRPEQARDASRILVTRADSLTEGLADLRSVRQRALRKLRDPLAKHGIFPVGAELAAPWDPGDLEPAAELTVAYFEMLQELGFFDLDKYAWYRRPPTGDTT